jgi:nucleoside-diphosphate-sugar epimerase
MTSAEPKPVIAVTGATGFIGRRFVERAIRAGHQIRALTRRPQPEMAGIAWINGDLDSRVAIAEMIDGSDALVHLAGLTKGLNWKAFNDINVRATEQLVFEADNYAEGRTFHFIHMSSLAASEPTLSHYARSKHLSEQSLHKNGVQAFNWTVLRPPAVYGPGDKELLAVWRMMKRGIAPAPGNRANRFSLIHVDDVVGAILAILNRSEAFAQVFELDDGNAAGYKMADVAAAASVVMERTVRVRTIPAILLYFAGILGSLGAFVTRNPAMLNRQKARELLHPDWTCHAHRLNDTDMWSPIVLLDKGLEQTLGSYGEFGL